MRKVKVTSYNQTGGVTANNIHYKDNESTRLKSNWLKIIGSAVGIIASVVTVLQFCGIKLIGG